MKKIIIPLLAFSLLSCSNKIEVVADPAIKKPAIVAEVIEPVDNVLKLPMDFSSPLVKYNISSKFGYRKKPMGGSDFDLHKGVDLVGPKNALVYAAKDGKVIVHYPPPNGHFKGHPIYGGMMLIDHGGGIYTLYGHFKRTFVGEGQRVKRGQEIGVQGNTGISTGDHVHFEILIDPTIYFKE